MEDELEDLERYLRGAVILTWGDAQGIDGGHPEKHRVIFSGGVQVLAKPALPGFERVPPREAAGWLVAKHLGFPGLVAATVVRDVPRLSSGDEMEHSVQVTWPDDRQWITQVDQLPESEVWEASIFDAVVAHCDHTNNNWFGVPDPSRGEAHLRLVDTGNAFDLNQQGIPNSSFYTEHDGDEIPEEHMEGARQIAENIPDEIEELLGEDEAKRVRDRAAQLVKDGVLHIQ